VAEGRELERLPDVLQARHYLQRKSYDMELTDEERMRIPEAHRPPTGATFKRNKVVELDLPPVRKIANLIPVLFERAEPQPWDVIELVIFTGLQASGKTTFFRERFAATHEHISKDAWPNARKKEQRQRRLVEEYLRAGRSVVVDNTNPTAEERAPLIEIARTAGARVTAYSFVVTVEEATRRNALREGRARVENVGIYSVAKRLRVPSEDEGFDQRFEVRALDGDFLVAMLLP
jgi:predicted kinase